jgi:CheY-like chemotaxis protein
MGGHLSVESRPEHGSRFWFSLVLPEAGHPGPSPNASVSGFVGYTGRRRTILIVDDTPDARSLLTQYLGSLGFNTVTAADGAEAVNAVEMHRPDCILMDLVMPGMDGFDAIRTIRRKEEFAKSKPAVIFAVSAGSAEPEDCDGFIPKPIHLDELARRIGDSLNLEWITDDGAYLARGTQTPDGNGNTEIPPAESLQIMCAAARRGDIGTVEEELHRLGELSSRFEGFIREASDLCDRFEVVKLRTFLRNYIEDQNND